jgi:hypothetical protein
MDTLPQFIASDYLKEQFEQNKNLILTCVIFSFIICIILCFFYSGSADTTDANDDTIKTQQKGKDCVTDCSSYIWCFICCCLFMMFLFYMQIFKYNPSAVSSLKPTPGSFGQQISQDVVTQ